MALLIILLLLPIFLFIILQKYNTRKHALIRLPPGPRGLPLIGNLHQLDSSNPPHQFWKLSKQYGPLLFLRLGFIQTLIVSSAKMAKEVLKTHDLQFCSRRAFLGQHTLSYNGLDLASAPYNECWRELRKLCVIHLFNLNRVLQFRPIREDEVSRMIEDISKSAVSSEPVNLSEILMSLTGNIICRVGFGRRYSDEGGSKKNKFTGKIHLLEKVFKELDMFYQELIDEHLDPNRPKTDDEDILDVLLQIRKDHDIKFDLTWDHIKAVLMNVFIAGSDTSAVTVVWAMTYLMKNAEAMRKAQEEIRHVTGNKGFVDEDDIQRLPYVEAIVKETMRLQPTIPLLLPRETMEKCSIDGYEIPARTRVYVNIWAIGRDPEVWDEPERFDPDRFMGSSSSIDLKGQNFELIPFGAGRRICPGMSMGLATVQLALANLLYKFDWEMPSGMKVEDLDFEMSPGITMHKKNALCLMPIAR
ncbi:putative Cytochrome P450 [Melia azedarach]|uniref:Cytochrome P450 n=1 Tax=Melia azedarach TaxID=155640 RepID=A0ACC1WSB8_MELAZ|nr:putative Cytochrome P450 [Melia azedarach]